MHIGVFKRLYLKVAASNDVGTDAKYLYLFLAHSSKEWECELDRGIMGDLLGYKPRATSKVIAELKLSGWIRRERPKKNGEVAKTILLFK